MLISLIRAVVLYLALILVVRLMGKRQLGEMEPMEFVVTMLIANLAAVPMQETGTPLLAGLLPILVVLSVELVLSVLTYRSVGMRRFLCGKPVILIENGRLLQQNLKKTRVNTDELAEYLRIQGVTDLSQVQYAILETSGNISILPYARFAPACAKDAGIKVERVIVRTMILSGAICGLIGLLLTAGTDHTLTTTIVGGRGFTAVMVSWMAKFNPIMMIFTSLLIVVLSRGASEISSVFSLNHSFADILTGIILFFIIGSEFFISYKVSLRKSKKEA